MVRRLAVLALTALMVPASAHATVPPPRRAFVRVQVPARPIVVGESVPIVVRAYVRRGTRAVFTGPPTLEGDAFAVHELVDRADLGQAEVRGLPYGTLTWRGRLTALRAGRHALRVAVPVRLRWREAATMDRVDGRPSRVSAVLAPLLSGLGRMRRARVAPSQVRELEIVEPPAEGRPADHAGAVGRFDLEAEVEPARVRVGEPFTLRLVVRGEGAFERVSHRLIARDERVRAYPVRARFEGRRGDGRVGAKTFEQLLVPLEPGRLALDPLTFSFFDPASGYVTRTSEALLVEVDPAPTRSYADLASAARPRPPLRARRGPTASLAPPVPDPRWLLAPFVAMGASVAVGWGLSRRNPRAALERRARRRRRRALARARRGARAAARRGDALAFFAAARTTVQLVVAGRLAIETPESITAADLAALDLPTVFREVLERADAMTFGGELDARDLEACCARLERALAEVRE